ncbi:MAG: hypothetical protein MI746_00990, partial [Pseudomonadales bacterium]|nr:hypothetical protein [Pseudomonadales bacterium]
GLLVWRLVFQSGEDEVVELEQALELGQEPQSQLALPDGLKSPVTNSPGSVSGPRASRERVVAELLEPLFVANKPVQEAVQSEIDLDFEGFLNTFASDRKAEIRDQLVLAYTEIRLAGIAIERGEFSAEEISAFENPQHVLDKMATVLTGEELGELSEALQARARSKFDLAHLSQIDLIAEDLLPGNRELLLDKLFDETYALTNPDGIGQAANLSFRTERQLEAINRTRESLRTGMSPDQFELVETVLSEQEQAVAAASLIFN